MSLAHSRTVGNNLAVATLNESAEVGFDFGAAHCTILMDGIYLTVVIEEYGEVVDVTLEIDMLPRTFCLVGYKHLHAMSVDIGEDIEFPIMITDTRCPYTLSVSLLTVFEAKLVAKSKEILHCVAAEAPVDEVLRMKYDYTRQTVHSGAGKIIVLSHPDNIGVTEFIVEQGIGVSAIPVVGSPRLCRGIVHAHHHKQGDND